MQIIYKPIDELEPYKNNPRDNTKAVPYVAESIKEYGFKVPIIIDRGGTIVAGHTRYLASIELGLTEVPCIVADDLTDQQIKEFRLVDNKVAEYATWDMGMLEIELSELDFDAEAFGFEIEPVEIDPPTQRLEADFIIPPFDIFDARLGAWRERKRVWRNMIGDLGQARDVQAYNNKQTNDKSKYKHNGVMPTEVSILDPVLSEIIIKWFTPCEGAKLFDPFAGDTVFGYVAGALGYSFTGIELRQEQVDFNTERVEGLDATYICDDGRNVKKHIEPESQDMLFSCPPYFDLEVYSDDPNDASNQDSYEDFIQLIDDAFSNAITRLKDNRFAVIVVGDIRDKKGAYYNFPNDVINIFRRNGLVLYNNIKLLTPYGTAQLRARKYMRSRKTAHVYQDVLVFYKGDIKKIKSIYPEVKVDESADAELVELG